MLKKDCFAYVKDMRMCKALDYLHCTDGGCKFYKTTEERCKGCKEAGCFMLTCKDCKTKGIY